MFAKIAFRNVFRNKRRTAFSIGVMVVGISILYLVIGFTSESLESIKRILTDQIGSVQIAHPDVFNTTTTHFDRLVSDEIYQQISELLHEDPRVTGITSQLKFAGLIGNRKGSTLLLATAIEPEKPVPDYSSLIEAGPGFGVDACHKEGDDPARNRYQILIDQKMAQTLGVGICERINIFTGTAGDTPNAASATIVGIFLWNSQTNQGQLGYVNMALAHRLLQTTGVERVIVKLRDFNRAGKFAAELQAKLISAGLELQVRSWDTLSQFYESVRQFWGVFSWFTMTGVSVLVFFSVLEVLTMSFLERTREVGTVRAIGTHRSQLFATFLMEGAVLGVAGGVLGVLGGMGLSALANSAGIMWTPPGAVEPIAVEVSVSLSVAVVPFLTAIVSTLLSAVYPSWKNSRVPIVKALNYV